ncbi:S1C family serine protease [Vallitalea okinawensis]|uniref:S1C family serine protease n=1 Tax=Vallitalea okinawensis TaxID=2078660 RepID=UPI0014789657|nr:trypsin-like peptidase domain-containing protein [Vallitalea okinawensis]
MDQNENNSNHDTNQSNNEQDVIQLGNSSSDQEQKSDNIYSSQSYNQWSTHTVNQYNDQKQETYEQKADNPTDTFNVNFDNKGPCFSSRNDGGNGGSKKKRKTWKVVAAIFLGVFLLSGVIGTSVYAGYTLADYFEGSIEDVNEDLAKNNTIDLTNKTDPVASQNTVLTVPEIAEKVGPSVVSINTKTKVNNGYMPFYGEGAGSGFIFEENEDVYYIATNNHVIEGASEISLTINGEVVNAYLQGTDPMTDLAVLYIIKSELPASLSNYIKVSQLGESDDLVVGELAVAIGNPLGLGETVTVGVVSAINRQIETESGQFTLIQTDAAINPGNSGGALVSGYGEIIGINTLKIGETDVEGIGFAIPIAIAEPVLYDIIENGSIQRPFIGIYGQDVTGELSSLYGLPVGVFIIDVIPGGPAEQVGLQQADVIVSLNDQMIKNMSDLKSSIESYEVGDQVTIKYIRDGRALQVSLTLQGQ